MWFQPVNDVHRQSNELYQKAVNITKVVSLCKDTGFDWLESLLHNVRLFFMIFTDLKYLCSAMSV